jgi:hypothetical protein
LTRTRTSKQLCTNTRGHKAATRRHNYSGCGAPSVGEYCQTVTRQTSSEITAEETWPDNNAIDQTAAPNAPQRHRETHRRNHSRIHRKNRPGYTAETPYIHRREAARTPQRRVYIPQGMRIRSGCAYTQRVAYTPQMRPAHTAETPCVHRRHAADNAAHTPQRCRDYTAEGTMNTPQIRRRIRRTYPARGRQPHDTPYICQAKRVRYQTSTGSTRPWDISPDRFPNTHYCANHVDKTLPHAPALSVCLEYDQMCAISCI